MIFINDGIDVLQRSGFKALLTLYVMFNKDKNTLTQTDLVLTSDIHFDNLYPEYIQRNSQNHWTPLSVATAAANFLAAVPNAKILDAGAGAGKFCIAALTLQMHILQGSSKEKILCITETTS